MLFIILAGIVLGGLAAIALSQPRSPEIIIWNDDAERRMLRDARVRAGWW
ncbi:MAG TPA: hypothetical protein VHT53_14145 [Candidatus Elarobacter sp.]|jgi:hypothetical protein|nr:hypothetical protein [Candidatus Elarobacter sp.]